MPIERRSRGLAYGAPEIVLALACAAALACGDAPDATTRASAFESTSQGMIQGTPAPTLVPLSDAQRRAIGALVADDRPFCTAWLAAPRHVVTAAHCVQHKEAPELLDVLFEGARGDVRVPVSSVAIAPAADVAVLGLGTDIPADADVAPLPIVGLPLDSSMIGTRIEAAGAGLGNAPGVRIAFAVHRVEQLEAATFLSFGEAGAGTCRGDSGGPFLRAIGDSVEVVGTSSSGAPDCSGRGRASRLDTLRAWLAARLSEMPSSLSTCLPETPDACRDSAVVSCRYGYLRASDCAPEGRRCGWSLVSGKSDCLSSACGTFDGHGACVAGVATWCGPGSLETIDCGARDLGCVEAGEAGHASCVACDACGGVCRDFANDAENCGRCRNRCVVAHGQGRCAEGECGLASCDDGFVASGGKCVAVIVPPSDEPPPPPPCGCAGIHAASASIWVAFLRRSRRGTARSAAG